MTYSHAALVGALLVACGPAVAGGINAPEAAPAPLIADQPTASRFAGAYAGATLGYAFSGDDRVRIAGDGVSGTDKIGDLELSGGTFGLQAGYRWDQKGTLIGFEVAAKTGNISDDFDKDGNSAENDMGTELSLRAELGWENNNQTMFYAFGGASWASFDYSAERAAGGDIDDDFSRTGYLGGVGVERALNDKWSLRGEYQYTNYGKEELEDSAGFNTHPTPDFHSVSIGLNYALGR